MTNPAPCTQPDSENILSLPVWETYPQLQTSERLEIARAVFDGLRGFARAGWVPRFDKEKSNTPHPDLLAAARLAGLVPFQSDGAHNNGAQSSTPQQECESPESAWQRGFMAGREETLVAWRAAIALATGA